MIFHCSTSLESWRQRHRYHIFILTEYAVLLFLAILDSHFQVSLLLVNCNIGFIFTGYVGFYNNKKEDNPFAGAFADPLCELNLRETSEFVAAYPSKMGSCKVGTLVEASTPRRLDHTSLINMTQPKRLEQAPPTPGRPVFTFNVGNQKKSVPSKWEDAEKWLISSSCRESPAQDVKQQISSKGCKQNGVFPRKGDAFKERLSVAEDKVADLLVTSFDESLFLSSFDSAFCASPSSVFLKDKYCESTKEGFLFDHSICQMPMKNAATGMVNKVGHRDVGTEFTTPGSTSTTRCHVSYKSSSPARHNTPTCVSGPLVVCKTGLDIAELHDLHLAKLETQFDSLVSNWSSREEEEEEVSKSLRHFEMACGGESVGVSAVSTWEEEEKTKSCIRYQREEAKIQAWVNLQSAKAEAESRKLEVKIQKMRSDLEEKLMKKMTTVHRKAEELRATAQLQHAQQIQRASGQAQKMRNKQKPVDISCTCIPCRNI